MPKKVAAAVVIKNGLVLLTRRAPGERHAGLWEFPGGKLEPGESVGECLERELREELGVSAAAGSIIMSTIHDYGDGAIELIAVQTELSAGELSLTVHDRAEWAPPEKLLEYQLAPADLPIARRLAERAAG